MVPLVKRQVTGAINVGAGECGRGVLREESLQDGDGRLAAPPYPVALCQDRRGRLVWDCGGLGLRLSVKLVTRSTARAPPPDDGAELFGELQLRLLADDPAARRPRQHALSPERAPPRALTAVPPRMRAD